MKTLRYALCVSLSLISHPARGACLCCNFQLWQRSDTNPPPLHPHLDTTCAVVPTSLYVGLRVISSPTGQAVSGTKSYLISLSNFSVSFFIFASNLTFFSYSRSWLTHQAIIFLPYFSDIFLTDGIALLLWKSIRDCLWLRVNFLILVFVSY